jgi:hypothetical protein
VKAKLVTAFAAGFLVAAILGFVGPISRPLCRPGAIEGWSHSARECRVGDYLVIAPDRQGLPDLLLARMGRPYLNVSKEETMLLDTEGQRPVYHWDRGKSVIAYAGFDATRKAWVDNLDFGADGVVDFRTTTIAGRQIKQELIVGDRWLEFVKRDGRTGVLLDGQFMSSDDARKKLDASGGSVK